MSERRYRYWDSEKQEWVEPVDLEDLAIAAAMAWLDWNPQEGDPVGCPDHVVYAITKWAQAVLPAKDAPIDLPDYEP